MVMFVSGVLYVLQLEESNRIIIVNSCVERVQSARQGQVNVRSKVQGHFYTARINSLSDRIFVFKNPCCIYILTLTPSSCASHSLQFEVVGIIIQVQIQVLIFLHAGAVIIGGLVININDPTKKCTQIKNHPSFGNNNACHSLCQNTHFRPVNYSGHYL